MMPNSGVGKKLFTWFDDRLPARALVEYLRKKSVPRHRHSFWYFFGGLTLFFIGVQVVTGVLLALYYTATPDQAYESVGGIVNNVPYGWLVRSVHSWSANLMIGTLFVHMFSVYLMKAYRRPREVMWLSGTVLLVLALGFAFTGYLLPWDTRAYFATLIGTEIPKSMPLLGAWGVRILRGSEDIGGATLRRMYTIHVIVLPLIAFAVVTSHLLLNQILGVSTPVGTKESGRPVPFFPNYLYRDVIVWVMGLAVLLALACLLPWGLGEKADPLASAPPGIKPEWYFLPLYETLRLLPAKILSVDGEFWANCLVAAGLLFWLMVPFLDRRSSHGQRSPFFTAIGVSIAFYLVLAITLAYVT